MFFLQQEGDDANSLVIEKDNVTGEIVSQVEHFHNVGDSL